VISLDTGWKQTGYFAEPFGFFGKASFEGYGLLEPAAFHGGPPFSSARIILKTAADFRLYNFGPNQIRPM
jgi:hypothetical protein